MTAIEYIEESGVPEAMWPNLAQWYGWFEKQGMVGIVKDGEEIAGVLVNVAGVDTERAACFPSQLVLEISLGKFQCLACTLRH